MRDEMIYTVTFTYKAELRGGTPWLITIKTSATVRGAEERDKLMKMLQDMGFEPSWGYLNAPNAKDAMEQLKQGFADFPPVKDG